MELWDLYNENRELTGKSHIRGNTIPDNYYHLVVHIWIKNSKGEYLISQRAENRPTFPLMWECAGGSVLKGETSIQGAIREVKEEVGIDLNEKDGEVVFTRIRKRFKDIMDVWLFKYDGEVSLDNATTKEVAQVKWMKKEQIKKLYEEEKLVFTLDYFFNEIDI